jgi:hypothetical protein
VIRFPAGKSFQLNACLTETPPSYRRAFWTSRHHLWLAVLTLGLGFATGEALGLLVGATLYALGLVFLPDMAFFRRAIDSGAQAVQNTETAAQLAAFQEQQQQLLQSLSTARRTRYHQLTTVCRDIEAASSGTHGTTTLSLDTRRRKLEELTWTYLRMLTIEQSLEVYLETERKEQVPALLDSIQKETQVLAAEVTTLKQKTPRPAVLDGKERLLTSRLERLNVLQQRLSRIEQAQANHDLVRSEQERLVEQAKLIRADAIASKNTSTLTARIDMSIEHLSATNKWLTELDEFKDLTSQIPVHPPSSTPASQSSPRRTAREEPPTSHA